MPNRQCLLTPAFKTTVTCLALLTAAIGSAGSHADETVTCASDHGGRNVCAVTDILQRTVTLAQDLSNGTCVRNKTWGTYAPGIWVDRGCVGQFTVSGSGSSASSGNQGSNTAAAIIGLAALAAVAAAVSKSNDKDHHGDDDDYYDRDYYSRHGDYDYDRSYSGAPSYVLRACGREAEAWVRDRNGRSASLDRVTNVRKKHGDWRLSAYYRFRYRHDSTTRPVGCVVDDDGRIRDFDVD